MDDNKHKTLVQNNHFAAEDSKLMIVVMLSQILLPREVF